MARIKVDLPEKFSYSTSLQIRITDLNYGGHVGNDKILSLMHEARVDYLNSLGYSELEFEGVSLIMSDAAIEFKSELFYGEAVTIEVAVNDLTRVGFDIYYRLKKNDTVVALAKTGMVCFDYPTKKVAALPPLAKSKLSSHP